MVVSIKRSDLFSIVFVVMIFVEILSCKSNNFSNNSVYNQDYVNYTRLINVGQKNVLPTLANKIL